MRYYNFSLTENSQTICYFNKKVCVTIYNYFTKSSAVFCLWLLFRQTLYFFLRVFIWKNRSVLRYFAQNVAFCLIHTESAFCFQYGKTFRALHLSTHSLTLTRLSCTRKNERTIMPSCNIRKIMFYKSFYNPFVCVYMF